MAEISWTGPASASTASAGHAPCNSPHSPKPGRMVEHTAPSSSPPSEAQPASEWENAGLPIT